MLPQWGHIRTERIDIDRLRQPFEKELPLAFGTAAGRTEFRHLRQRVTTIRTGRQEFHDPDTQELHSQF